MFVATHSKIEFLRIHYSKSLESLFTWFRTLKNMSFFTPRAVEHIFPQCTEIFMKLYNPLGFTNPESVEILRLKKKSPYWTKLGK